MDRGGLSGHTALIYDFFYNLTHHSITIKPYHLSFKEGWPKSSWRASYLDLWVDLLRLSSHTGHPIVSPLFFFFTFFSHFYQIQYEAYLSIVDFFHFILSSMVVKAAIKRLGWLKKNFDDDILNLEAIQLWSGMLQLEMSILDVWNYYTFASWPLEQNLSWEGNTTRPNWYSIGPRDEVGIGKRPKGVKG